MSTIDKIVIGGHEFTREDILSGEIFVSNSIPCDELAADALNATLDGSEERHTIFAPSDADGLLTVDDELFTVLPRFRVLAHDLSAYGYGEPVYYYRDNVLVGKFYLVRPQRVGKQTFDISCTSAIGLLGRLDHYGGIYNGTLAGAIISNIIGGAIEYTVDPVVAAIPVYGWLPIGTRRDNLRQVLFAIGASIKKTSIGEVNITFLDSKDQTAISDDRLSLSGSVDYKTPATAVAVTEHSYGQFATDETVTLYDGPVNTAEITTPGGAAATGMLVKFSDPAHSLNIIGGTIVERGVNYAVLSGGNVTLTGKKYTHTTNVITRRAKALPPNTTENLVKVEDATLVSAANSGNVAERVLAFYSATRVIRTNMVYGNERPGDAVALNDPFGEDAAGIVQSQSISISNTLMADTEIAVGYAPTGGGNNFENVQVITQPGEWTVPAGVTKIRAVLISGGKGGYSGEKGEDGGVGESYSFDRTVSNYRRRENGYKFGPGGEGGEPGPGGSGGRVYEIDIDVTPGQKFDVLLGVGGAGGVCVTGEPRQGDDGTDTTFGEHSSRDGGVRPNGYTEIFSGTVYAGNGEKGIPGGKGSGATEDGLDSTTGDTVGSWAPGGSGADATAHHNFNPAGDNYATAHGVGGPGGGAAYGANGAAGIAGNASKYGATETSINISSYGGKGGTGAKPVAQSPQTKPGFGGPGGHGGGGGGGGGLSATVTRVYSGRPYTANERQYAGPGGLGGLGGDGGHGAPGCAIIYY